MIQGHHSSEVREDLYGVRCTRESVIQRETGNYHSFFLLAILFTILMLNRLR